MLVIRRLLLASLIALLAALGTSGPVDAHSGIQSYVYVSVFDDGLQGRVEYPVADLGTALGIDFPDDPDEALAVAESRVDDIIAYTDEHLDLSGDDGSWNLVFDGVVDYLDAAGGYFQVPFVVDESFDETPRAWTATYDGIIESNPERDALFLIEDDWDSATFRNEGEHLLGFSVGNEIQEIALDEVSTVESISEIALLGSNSIDESAIAVLTLILVLSAATLGRVRSDSDRPRPTIAATLMQVAMSTGVVIAGLVVSLWVTGLMGADVSERFAVLLAALGVLVAAGSRWLDDRRALLAAGVAGVLVGVLVGFRFVDQLLDRSRTVLSLIGFSAGMAGWVVFVVALLLPLSLLLARHRLAPGIATTIAAIGVLAGTVWAIERAFDLVFKLRTAEFDAANAATQPILIGIVTVVVGFFVLARSGRSDTTASASPDPSSDPSIGDPELDHDDPRRTETQTTEAP